MCAMYSVARLNSANYYGFRFRCIFPVSFSNTKRCYGVI